MRAFLDEPLASPFRLFLAGCIESFLRAAPAADRLLLGRMGLLAHVVTAIAGASDSNSMQCLFDLLAELLRFCPPAVASLDATAGRDRLLAAAQASLVASNVFVRVLCLTTHSSPTTPCGRFVCDSDSRLRLVASILNTLSVSMLGPDSISCLNTCVLLLLFARRSELLPALLAVRAAIFMLTVASCRAGPREPAGAAAVLAAVLLCPAQGAPCCISHVTSPVQSRHKPRPVTSQTPVQSRHKPPSSHITSPVQSRHKPGPVTSQAPVQSHLYHSH